MSRKEGLGTKRDGKLSSFKHPYVQLGFNMQVTEQHRWVPFKYKTAIDYYVNLK